MARVTHFEIHAADPERAMRFYDAVFGWTYRRWEGPFPYWMVITGPDSEEGINGGLMERRGPPPADGQAVNAYVCTAAVADVDEVVKKATAAGGSVALPKMAIPGVGWLAYCKDTEGNIFGMMQEDTSAA